MTRRLNLIIVPAEGGQPKRLNVPVIALHLLGIAVVVLFAALVVVGITWKNLLNISIDYHRIAEENTRLESENQRIVGIIREVEQSRQILARIIRSLGGQVDLSAVNPEHIPDNFDDHSIPNEKRSEFSIRSLASEEQLFEVIPSEMPVNGFISQGFFEDHLFPARSHRGIDIAGKTGTPIKAAGIGRVVFSGWTEDYGNCLMIAHPSGYISFYGHNHINLKQVNNDVSRGEPIALLGSTGKSSAPHLHFEIWLNGVPLDPMNVLKIEDNKKSL